MLLLLLLIQLFACLGRILTRHTVDVYVIVVALLVMSLLVSVLQVRLLFMSLLVSVLLRMWLPLILMLLLLSLIMLLVLSLVNVLILNGSCKTSLENAPLVINYII